jgi:hypothetical protein
MTGILKVQLSNAQRSISGVQVADSPDLAWRARVIRVIVAADGGF